MCPIAHCSEKCGREMRYRWTCSPDGVAWADSRSRSRRRLGDCLSARYQMEQVCAKTEADVNATAAATASAGSYSVRWKCSVHEFPGSQPPSCLCTCVPVF